MCPETQRDAVRLQKLLSEAGICSRRKAEQLIQEGKVSVNGIVAQLGDRADPLQDEILLEGKPVRVRRPSVTLMLYKPRGVVTTLSDEHGRKSVDSLVSGCGGRVWPIGRLDMDSEGMLIMTDDGALTQAVLHPKHEVEKEYLVWVEGFSRSALEEMRKPMVIDGYQIRPAVVKLMRQGENSALLSVCIHEGRNRQIRRMCSLCGLSVRRLKRIREGALSLDRDLKPGQWRLLTQQEKDSLMSV